MHWKSKPKIWPLELSSRFFSFQSISGEIPTLEDFGAPEIQDSRKNSEMIQEVDVYREVSTHLSSCLIFHDHSPSVIFISSFSCSFGQLPPSLSFHFALLPMLLLLLLLLDSLLPLVLPRLLLWLLLQLPAAKHHGPKGRSESKIYVSRGRNVPSEILQKACCWC